MIEAVEGTNNPDLEQEPLKNPKDKNGDNLNINNDNKNIPKDYEI